MKKIFNKEKLLASAKKAWSVTLRAAKSAGRFTDNHTAWITACIMATVLAVLFIPLLRDVTDRTAMTLGEIRDWGMSFEEPNTPPQGNVSNEELKKYDACYMGDTTTNKIWLTFDAGYENGYTEKILDTLKEKNVKATFFLVGHYFKTRPELVKRMVMEGHTIGNHTSSHPDMSQLTGVEALKAELEPVEALYKEITGEELPKYYRPPQGKFSTDNLTSAKQLGYKTLFWSVAYVDWNNNSQPDPQSAITKLNSRIHGGAVVLLHSTSATNADILGSLIDGWREMGYEFASPEELFE